MKFWLSMCWSGSRRCCHFLDPPSAPFLSLRVSLLSLFRLQFFFLLPLSLHVTSAPLGNLMLFSDLTSPLWSNFPHYSFYRKTRFKRSFLSFPVNAVSFFLPVRTFSPHTLSLFFFVRSASFPSFLLESLLLRFPLEEGNVFLMNPLLYLDLFF